MQSGSGCRIPQPRGRLRKYGIIALTAPRRVQQLSELANWNNTRLNMATPPTMRDLAHRLFAYEAVVGKTPEPVEFATLRVYEKLRQSLSAFVGVAAFESLAFRALTQAKSEAPGLWAVQVAE